MVIVSNSQFLSTSSIRFQTSAAGSTSFRFRSKKSALLCWTFLFGVKCSRSNVYELFNGSELDSLSLSLSISLSNHSGHFNDSTLSNGAQKYVFHLFLIDHANVAASPYCLSLSIGPGLLSSLCIDKLPPPHVCIDVVLLFSCWDAEVLGTSSFVGSVQRIVW